jgi:uncharacterized membrane protein YkoI
MNIKPIVPFSLAALLAVGVAHAKDRDHEQEARDTAALATMKVTLQQAIGTAEQQTGSRAMGADVSQERGATRIAVEVAGPQGVKTVLVDAQTGQVTATHDGGRDDEDND